MPRMILAALAVFVGACDVQISPRTQPLPSFPEAQYTANTFWYSNDRTVPKKRMLRAAAKACQVPKGSVERLLIWQEPYGLHGSWWLDFACPSRTTG